MTVALALALALLVAQQADPGWLVGTWCTEKSEVAKSRTCETWTPMANGLLGVGQTRHEHSTTIDERMEIRRDGGVLVFHAEPHGQAPADFRASGEQPAMALRFENRAHDYPQVVRYWREGELLMAEISLADGSKAMRWTYRREKD